MLDQLAQTGYSIIINDGYPVIKQQIQAAELDDLIASWPVASPSFQETLIKGRKRMDIRANKSKQAAILVRNKSILADLPVVSNPEFTMSVSEWFKYNHHKDLQVTIVGRQGDFLALQTKFN